MPEVSIVILAKNQEAFIDDTLKAVFGQETGYSIEVIVIDSGSQDKTLEIVKRYPVALIQISPEEFGHGKTRNLGLSVSKGKYVVFLNSDAAPKNKHWLNSLLAPFSKYENVAATYSKTFPRTDCNPLDARDILDDDYLFGRKVKYIESFPEYNKLNAEQKRKLVSFYTVSCAIDKSILLENPFRDIQFGEDLEWSKRILEKGFRIIFEPDSEVIHSHNLHLSFIKTAKKYFDDTRLNQIVLKRWTVSRLSRLPLVYVINFMKDAKYVLNLKRDFSYKFKWLIYSPIVRMAEPLGILLGVMPFIPERLAEKMSLVEEIKQA